jgi:hypothetical protein
MIQINSKRVLLGAVAGWVVWMVWSGIVNMVILVGRYAAAQKAGMLLTTPRYGFFLPAWFIMLFVLSYLLAWLYAGVRATYGAGAGTAIKVGLFVGFAIGFPMAFSSAAWSPMSRVFPLWWMLELWGGAIASTFVAAWLYRDA